MKLLRIGIRFWITTTSILSFLTGWIMLAHAPKPNQAGSPLTRVSAPLPTLEPLNLLPGFDSDEGRSQTQPFFNTRPNMNSQFRPSFRTGGS